MKVFWGSFVCNFLGGLGLVCLFGWGFFVCVWILGFGFLFTFRGMEVRVEELLCFNFSLRFLSQDLLSIFCSRPRSQNELSFVTRVAGCVHHVPTIYTWPHRLVL